MAINKVEINNSDGTKRTLMDLTEDTATPSDVLSGVSFHDASGAQRTGTLIPVMSVNGKTGTVVIGTDDITYDDGSVSDYFSQVKTNINSITTRVDFIGGELVWQNTNDYWEGGSIPITKSLRGYTHLLITCGTYGRGNADGYIVEIGKSAVISKIYPPSSSTAGYAFSAAFRDITSSEDGITISGGKNANNNASAWSSGSSYRYYCCPDKIYAFRMGLER